MNVGLFAKSNDKNKKEPIIPTPSIVRDPPRLSHRAASVAQEMETLELELNACQLRLQEETNARKVADSIIAELKSQLEHARATHERELAHVRNERDLFQFRFTDVAARFCSMQSIINDVMKITEQNKQAPSEPVSDSFEQALQPTIMPEPPEEEKPAS